MENRSDTDGCATKHDRATATCTENKTNCTSSFKLKPAKVILRDIKQSTSLWSKNLDQNLCETCRPRIPGSCVVAEHETWCKRSCRRKNCEELLKSWKAPTRRHRLPRHLHDFVVDSTVLRLIEFSNWYNRGRMARQCETVKELLTHQREVLPRCKQQGCVMKRNGVDMKEWKRHYMKEERDGCKSHARSCSTVTDIADQTRAPNFDPKRRGRPMKSTLQSVKQASKNIRGRTKRSKDKAQANVIISAPHAVCKHRGKTPKCKNEVHALKESNVSALKNDGRSKMNDDSVKGKHGHSRHLGKAKKCKDALKAQLISSSCLGSQKRRGRPRKSNNASVSVKCRPHKVKNTLTTVANSRGRQRKYTDIPDEKQFPSSSIAKQKPTSRSPRCIKFLQSVPDLSSILEKSESNRKSKRSASTSGRCVGPKIGLKLKDNLSKTASKLSRVSSCSSTVTESKHPGQSKIGKTASIVNQSLSSEVHPKHDARAKKPKNLSKAKSASMTSNKARNQSTKIPSTSIKDLPNLQEITYVQRKAIIQEQKNGKYTTKSCSRKRKCNKSTSRQGRPKTLQNEEICSPRLLPSINSDFSIDDGNSSMNIEEYLTQLGTYLECIDSNEYIVEESGSMDENNNFISDSAVLHKSITCTLENINEIHEFDAGAMTGINSGDVLSAVSSVSDENNNADNNANVIVRGNTRSRKSDSGISDISFDSEPSTNCKRKNESEEVYGPVQDPKSKKSKTKRRREDSNLEGLKRRRSERLIKKENYRRCKAMWTDEGNRRRVGRSILTGNLSGAASTCTQQVPKQIDEHLLEEFVAMCPLDDDVPFSEEECRYLLSESSIFNSNGWTPSRCAGLNQHRSGNTTGNATCSKNPPKVRRYWKEFLVDEFSIHLLASRSRNSLEKCGEETCRVLEDEWSGQSTGSSQIKMHPCFGPLTQQQFILLKQLGLDAAAGATMGGHRGTIERAASGPTVRSSQDVYVVTLLGQQGLGATEREPVGDLKDHGRKDRIDCSSEIQPHPSKCQTTPLRKHGLDAREDQQGGCHVGDLGRRKEKVSQSVRQPNQEKTPSNGDKGENGCRNRNQDTRSEDHQGPVVVIPRLPLGGDQVSVAAAEVWLPASVLEFSNSSMFFLPLGEWSDREKWWHVKKVLWRNGEDGIWYVSEAPQRDVMTGICFVPEEAWLVSQGMKNKNHRRVYTVLIGSDTQAETVPSKASAHGSGCRKTHKEARNKCKKNVQQMIPIPVPPPLLGVQSVLQPLQSAFVYPRVLAMPYGFYHIPDMVLSTRPQIPTPIQNSAPHQQQGAFIGVPLDQVSSFQGYKQQGISQHNCNSAQIVQNPNHHGQNSFDVFQHQPIIGNPCCMTHQVTNGHFIGLDGYVAATQDRNSYTPLGIAADDIAKDALDNPGGARDAADHGCNLTNQSTSLTIGQTADNMPTQNDQSFDLINDTNNNSNDRDVEQSNASSETVPDVNNNIVTDYCGTPVVEGGKECSTQVDKEIFTVPLLSEAQQWIETCQDMTLLGKALLEWCKSSLSPRIHDHILNGIMKRVQMGSVNQSSQNFCVFAASFHASAQKGNYSPHNEDECILVQLGLSALLSCLEQEQQPNGNGQIPVSNLSTQDQLQEAQSQTDQGQTSVMRKQSQPTEVQDLSLQACLMEIGSPCEQFQCQPGKTKTHPLQAPSKTQQVQGQLEDEDDQDLLLQNLDQIFQDQLPQNQNHIDEGLVNLEQAQSPCIPLVQVQPVQGQTQAIQDQSQPLHDQDQLSQVQPREDAYCILQMLLHLKLPLTEVLASLSQAKSPETLQWPPEKLGISTIRKVLSVLADFDPAMAFTIIQGLGWDHTLMAQLRENRTFREQQITLAEALLDCDNFGQCRLLLSYLISTEGCRESCRHLYSSLLGKLLDTETQCEPAMMVFEDMMESCLVVPAPILSKLLMLLYKQNDDDGLEDALCVFHYGLGLGIYPMYRMTEDKVWEASVFVGATEAEIFFSLKTLLDELHHRHMAQLEGVLSHRGRRDSGIHPQETCRKSAGKSMRWIGYGRCGGRKRTMSSGPSFKKKGRKVAFLFQEVQKGIALTDAKDYPKVKITLMERKTQQGTMVPQEVVSTKGLSKLLSTKHAIQSVLNAHFDPLTLEPCNSKWGSITKKKPLVLVINEDALKSWLIVKSKTD